MRVREKIRRIRWGFAERLNLPPELEHWRASPQVLALVEALWGREPVPPMVIFHLLEQRRRDEVIALEDRAAFWESEARRGRDAAKTHKLP